MRRVVSMSLGLLALAGLLAGCGEDAVVLEFRPPAGAATTFIAETSTRTHTEVPGTAPDVEQGSVLLIEQRVTSTGAAGSVVDLQATFLAITQNGLPGPAPSPVQARFAVDRQGHAENLATATVSTSDTARQGLPEITAPFPADRVRPGQEWGFSPPAGRSGFGGKAKLVHLGQRDGVKVAEIEATLSVPVDDTEIRGRDGPVTIGGPLTLRLRGTYEIETGLLVESHEELRGDFRLRFTLQGSNSPPVAGSQTLLVVTETRRA